MRIFEFLLLSALPAGILPGPVRAQDYPLTNRDLRATTVSPTSGVATMVFTADPALSGEDIFDVVSSDPGVVVTLLVPSGAVINASNAEGQGFAYDTFTAAASASAIVPGPLSMAGTHTVISLPGNSVPGTYTIQLDPAGASSTALVIASYFSSSGVRAGLFTGKPSYQLGETIAFSGIVYDGATPVTGATTTVSVVDPADASFKPVQTTLAGFGPWHDATGDGVYLGTFQPTRSGRFTAAMQVTGTSVSGIPFSRTASTSFRVTAPLAKFVSFQDSALDDNGDGTANRVVVTANVKVQTAGKYQFGISLVSSGGAVIKSGTIVTLDTGDQAIAASFAAAALARLGENGPYARQDAVLVYLDDPENPVAAIESDAGASSAYNLAALTGGRGAASITVDQSSLAFGNVPNGASKDLILTFHNGSAFPLSESVLPVTNPNFSVIAPSPFPLPAGVDQKLTVRFSPKTAGAQTGTLTVAGLSIALSGAGVAAAPVLSASPSSLDFGAVAIGQSKVLSVTVSNTGSTSVTLAAAAITSRAFSVLPAFFKLGPGAQQAVNFQFAPADSTPQSVTVTFQGDDPARSTIVITLAGNGTAAVPPAVVLTSDTFNRPDADQDSLGVTDRGLGGTQTYCYVPIWTGAVIASHTLEIKGTGFGGVQFGQPGAGNSCSYRGQDIGQDLNLVVDLMVPRDAAGNSSLAGPYFRNRSAAAADGILGGDSAGYWVRLDSSGIVTVEDAHAAVVVATTAQPASFDNNVFHVLEVAVSGATLQAALDHSVLTFVQGGGATSTVSIPATGGSNNGTAGVAFGLAPKSGRIGGERSDALIVTQYRSLIRP